MVKTFEMSCILSGTDCSLLQHSGHYFLRVCERLVQRRPTKCLMLQSRGFLEAQDLITEQLLRDRFITALPLSPCTDALATRLADMFYSLMHRRVD